MCFLVGCGTCGQAFARDVQLLMLPRNVQKIVSAQGETGKGTQDTHMEATVSSHPNESSKCAPRQLDLILPEFAAEPKRLSNGKCQVFHSHLYFRKILVSVFQ